MATWARMMAMVIGHRARSRLVRSISTAFTQDGTHDDVLQRRVQAHHAHARLQRLHDEGAQNSAP